jgi:hypothetical protein
MRLLGSADRASYTGDVYLWDIACHDIAGSAGLQAAASI